jgi:hypothetical protein
VSLAPGENVVILFTNSDNVTKNLTIENISAPSAILPYVVITPTTIGSYENENVTITFVRIPQSIRATISSDIYSIQIAGLVVYLDMTENYGGGENLENQVALLSSRIDVLIANTDNLLAGIKTLENAPSLIPQIENLRAELLLLKAKVYENSDNYAAEIEPMKTRYDQALTQIRIYYDDKIDRARADGDTRALEYAVLAGLVAMLIVVYIVPLLRHPNVPTRKFIDRLKSSAGLKSRTLVPEITEDQVVMKKNEIATAKERGAPALEIAEMEAELKILESRLGLDKLRNPPLVKQQKEKPTEQPQEKLPEPPADA